jgi:hypothetical protein
MSNSSARRRTNLDMIFLLGSLAILVVGFAASYAILPGRPLCASISCPEWTSLEVAGVSLSPAQALGCAVTLLASLGAGLAFGISRRRTRLTLSYSVLAGGVICGLILPSTLVDVWLRIAVVGLGATGAGLLMLLQRPTGPLSG